MQCSEGIAQLAAALAKAQVELQNPPKSLIAYLDERPDGSPGQAYRYAPLSAGLDIVRKALGAHEIAVVQTTAVDAAAERLILTTTLAHASGEWLGSSWPVCGKAEMAHPKLMGAALTYARRYNLFALVGLAGEDDLDTPDLKPAQASDKQPEPARPAPAPSGPLHRASAREARLRVNTRIPGSGGAPPSPDPPIVDLPDLIGSLEAVDTSEALLRWSLTALPSCSALDDTARSALGAAFLARAEALSVDPDLLLAFNVNGPRRRRRRTGHTEQPQSLEQAHVPQPAL